MVPHPSLIAPKIKLDLIQPVETMGPYELCWCRSGKKYKWCHFRREQQKPVNIYELEAKMIAEFRDGYCSFPDPSADPCSAIITKAHTVQKKGGLAAIAEAGHVLTVKPSMKEMIETDGNPQPRKVGVNNASVFPGFCSRHDTTLFKPIEGKTLSLTKDIAFLFSYRAIAYERFAKEAQLRITYIQREADCGQPFWKQAMIQMQLAPVIAGIRIGMRDLDLWKGQFDQRLLSGARDDFHFVSVRFDQVLPVVACCAFHPEFDLHGKPLQQLGRDGVDFDHVTITVTTFQAQTIVVFGWIGSDDGPAKALAESFAAIEDERKADALIRLLFIHTDNLFLRPSWWVSLPPSERQVLNEMTRSGTIMRARSAGEMADDARSFSSAHVAEIVRG
ncbi:zinc chelation protein SecC [Bradyrhizobium sp. SUTN9-2]|uniref:SEC-C domain-containing protein n=1 Tax=Bradyrhizobium sp. SUTN9-2 TaxID=1167456 RepID=UPI000D65C5BA|nr:SEC-C domain-containing protein [Bradyrhizobium sp. SUTN9-2]PWE78696.1 zinc chelation protein SecC [Bradyrhizobium sp. SUTN9-2]